MPVAAIPAPGRAELVPADVRSSSAAVAHHDHWDRHAIKAALYRRGVTLIGLARAAGIEPSATRTALLRRNRPGEAAIAAALGVAPAELWPERYPPSSDTPAAASAPSRRAPPTSLPRKRGRVGEGEATDPSAQPSRRHAAKPAQRRPRRSSPNRVGV